MTTLYLASGSPRRQQLLKQLGLTFTMLNINVLEHYCAGESPRQYVCRLARAKARAGVAIAPQDIPVLGADTAVVTDGEIFGKPAMQPGHIRCLWRCQDALIR